MPDQTNPSLLSELEPASGPRVIRAPLDGEGVLLNDRHFRLEDIDELVEELTRQSEGRLAELRQAASEVEDRLRRQAEQSRARIQQAMAVARDRIDRQLEATATRSREILDRRHTEGYEEGRAAGYRSGYEEGLQRGLEAGLLEGRARGHAAAHQESLVRLEEELGPLRAAVQELAREFERDWQGLFVEARAEVIELALAAARSILQDAIEECPERVVAQLGAALERLGARHRVAIELHPADRAAVERFLAGAGARLLDGAAVSLVENPALARGGCRVLCGETRVDADLDTQLAVVREHLQGVNGGHA